MCGIGVESLIPRTSRPDVARARIADSRPDPGPLTRTSTVRIPTSFALDAAVIDACCAANGVPLRDPRKPSDPALDQEIVLPSGSEIVTISEKAAIKEDTRHLARDKEEFRRGGELEHFTVKGEEGRLHEVQVKLQLLAQERLRKENEFKHKEDMQKEIHREINFMEQEISQLEVELSRLTHPGT